MGQRRRRWIKWLAGVVLVILAGVAGSVLWLRWRIGASLPVIDGQRPLAHLSAPATIERDAQGVPTIRGATRLDVVRALGFAHAQDRFFQMDLLRRRGSGQLAALVGPAAIEIDKSVRRHGLYPLADQVYGTLPDEQHALLEAYAEGVNAGLASLPHLPWEYAVLGVTPKPWQPSDTVRVSYAMALDMLDEDDTYELSRHALRETRGLAVLDYFNPRIGPDDSDIDSVTAPLPPIPSAKLIDLRKKSASPLARLDFEPATPRTALAQHDALASIFGGSLGLSGLDRELAPYLGTGPDSTREQFPAGSNSFAVAGGRTPSGAALLANDPHLSLGLPNVWYHAALEWTDPERGPWRTVGATLPGVPMVAIGSNGHIAWGFTASLADTSDLILLEQAAADPRFYVVPGKDGGPTDFAETETRVETIEVKGATPVKLETEWTRWGSIVGRGQRDRRLAVSWTMQDPQAMDFAFQEITYLTSTDEVLQRAPGWGMIPFNILVADTTGKVGWTISGRLPHRVGFDGSMPVPWAYGDRRWDGLLPPDQTPRRVITGDATISTANQRLVAGDDLTLVGDGGYELPYRGARIHQLLAALPPQVKPADLAAIQLDTHAILHDRWLPLLLSTLSPATLKDRPERTRLRAAIESGATEATADSVGYRLLRGWRYEVRRRVTDPIYAPAREFFPGFSTAGFDDEPAVWQLVHERPANLLDPRYADWDALLLSAVDAVIDDLAKQGVSLTRATWGSRNTARIRHPFGLIAPGWLPGWATSWLAAPPDPLPGDSNMPRVLAPAYGASMRLVVSPGHEDEGLWQMPGGASGNPRSPYFLAGHEDWVAGHPTPLLPGPPKHTLTLSPEN